MVPPVARSFSPTVLPGVPPPSSRRLAVLLTGAVGGLVLLVAIGYLALCGYLATQVTRAARQPLEGTPADLGLLYEAAA